MPFFINTQASVLQVSGQVSSIQVLMFPVLKFKETPMLLGFETEILDKLKWGIFFIKALKYAAPIESEEDRNRKSIKKKLLVVWKCRRQG